ncbi:Leucine rich repeat-containing protein [Xylanibacter ruminicola]|uniref:Leucine rich repeat-containing protein n=1 Tax=Xylanibacter ruminicola TaxID=839 RepID=A0A1M7D1A0_XYLRU|nr:leucine-rich repeat domain-containing protein [Xylanibacter ruminicola]SHL73183.1 Leucine rich repeat-containing protein [Xylanibacter ruminicola]
MINKRIFNVAIGLFIAYCANAGNVKLSNDTLYCNLNYDEVGTLKSQTSDIPDLNVIKTLVIGGYISQPDEDFIHTLGKQYSLENLDMTELYSSMSYQGLEGCVKIRSVKYSKHWTSTVQYLFEDCTNLSEVLFPNDDECALTTMPSGTFRGCTSLETITIPGTITHMDSQVFYLCGNLKEIHLKSGNAPFATSDTFGGQFSSATIYVPTGSLLNYRTAAGWCLFENIKEDANYHYNDDGTKISNNVALRNDTLFCNMTNEEQGSLRASVLGITSEINSIKHAVLEGFLNKDDGSFLNSLCCAYSLISLDMTNLQSTLYNFLFQGCTKLSEVKYSRYWNSTGWYLFEDCSNLKKIEFPDNYIYGGYNKFETGTFRGCSSLEEITIPATVTSIGSQCFYLCSNLKTITLKSANPPSAKEDSFGNQFTTAKLIVPKGTKAEYQTAAGWSLFSNIEEGTEDAEVVNKEISDNVSFSDETLFVNLPYEEVGRLKATVLSKYNNELNNIKKVVLTNSIGQDDANFLNSLASSYNLSEIDFTELRNDFGNFAFQGCAKLTKVYYSKYWGATGWYLFEDCSNLKEVVFPDNYDGDGYTQFTTGTFRGCSSLIDIQIPANVSTIGSQCFYLCGNLKNVTFLGAKITHIDKGAFEGCYSLETLTLPSSLSLIEERCFEGCSSIKEIHCDAITPPEISESSFDNIYSSATLYVPTGCSSKYSAAPVWRNFTTIKESSSTGINTTKNSVISETMTIYALDGNLVYSGHAVTKFEDYLPKGIYIVSHLGKTKKITIQ